MSSIGIVDDNPAVLSQMQVMLKGAGLGDVRAFSDPMQALAAFRVSPPTLLLVDYLMPGLNGVELLERLHDNPAVGRMPVALVSGCDNLAEVKLSAYSAGIHEVISKPLEPQEFTLKVRNLLRLSSVGRAATPAPELLFPGSDQAMARLLERVAALRDEPTGKHTARIAQYAGVLARHLGWDAARQDALVAAAPLHDIGKIGVPDSVLLKRGGLSAIERQILQRHTVIGHELLRDEEGPVMQVAAEIALSHHERWDGEGYPLALSGPAIPMSARIVAVADAFDLMTTIPPHDAKTLIGRASAVIQADKGHQFDPAVVDAFVRGLDDLRRVKHHFDVDEAFVPMSELPY